MPRLSKDDPAPESVWDYPRPPALRRCTRPITVSFGGVIVADTRECWQVLETSHPPTYYLPRDAFLPGNLVEAAGTSWCEWKGTARYVDVVSGDRRAERAGWHYPAPQPGFEPLVGHVALYAGAMDRCTVDGVAVLPQPGGFYGGWITPELGGPFKGVPGSRGW